MRIEYLATGSADCPLIRLFDFSRHEASELASLFARLSDGTADSADLSEAPWAQPVSGCRLLLQVGTSDVGITPTSALNEFICLLTRERWSALRDLAEPFCAAGPGTYQWLDDCGPVSLLLSRDWRW
jgi:hypothetical protein